MYASTHFYETGFKTFYTTEAAGVAKVIVITNTQHSNMSSAMESTNALAWATACSSSDYTVVSNTSGYRVNVSTKAELINATTLESTGVAGHIHVGTTATLYYVTTCTTKKLQSGDTVTMPWWYIWIKQPTTIG